MVVELGRKRENDGWETFGKRRRLSTVRAASTRGSSRPQSAGPAPFPKGSLFETCRAGLRSLGTIVSLAQEIACGAGQLSD